MTDFQLLTVLDALVRLAKSGAGPSVALITVVGTSPAGARGELAKLATEASVAPLLKKLDEAKTSVFAPAVVGEAAAMLRDPKRRAWLVEVGRLAASG